MTLDASNFLLRFEELELVTVPSLAMGRDPETLLVPWKRDDLHKSRSAAPGWQGAKSEHIGHM